MFSKVFGGPRLSKTGSEDPRRLPRSYLGLLRAILSHLWGMLGPGVSKIAPAALDRAPGPQYWILLGSNLGTELAEFFSFVGPIFWTRFWTLFRWFMEPFWGDFLGPDQPKRVQHESQEAN